MSETTREIITESESDSIYETDITYDDCYDPKFQERQNSSLILEILKQIKPGVDLLRVSLPAWILEKRSFLEKITDIFAHQQLLFK
jgi:hypothetical protein